MVSDAMSRLLAEQLVILAAAARVLEESYARVTPILKKKAEDLTIAERESCEALTSRFARLSDFLFQKAFRTVDRMELVEEGTAIDRLNRMEKRGVIRSATEWRELRELRNEIVHEYVIDKSDHVLIDAHAATPALLESARAFEKYVAEKGYVLSS